MAKVKLPSASEPVVLKDGTIKLSMGKKKHALLKAD